MDTHAPSHAGEQHPPIQLSFDDDDPEVSVAETVAMLLATTAAVVLVSVLAVALGIT